MQKKPDRERHLKLHMGQRKRQQETGACHPKIFRDDRGSAMLVAIVVSVVVIAFSLSMLLVSYSLFVSSVKEGTKTQCRELTKSVSLELEQEITPPQFADLAEQESARGKYPLYFYLCDNLSNDKWPYYGGEGTPYHTASYAYRYFQLDVSGGEASEYVRMADEISVCMYWTPEDGTENADEGKLTMLVKCVKGDQSCIIRSDYAIQVSDFAAGGGQYFSFLFEERE